MTACADGITQVSEQGLEKVCGGGVKQGHTNPRPAAATPCLQQTGHALLRACSTHSLPAVQG